jgi:hypothetical protein
VADHVISRDDVDEVLAGLGAAHDRIGTVMYAIDTHPGLNLLRHGKVSGRTETMWRALRPEVDLVWVQFATLGDLLERARSVRARPRLGADEWEMLTRLLRGPIVLLDADGLPVDATTAPAGRMSVGEFTQQLERRCTEVLAHLSEMDASWTAVAAAFVRVSESVDAVVALAGQAGEPGTEKRTRTALAEVERFCVDDPLAAAPGGRLTDAAQRRLADLDRTARQARQQLNELVRLRDGYPQRRAALTSVVDELAAAEEGVARSQSRVGVKVADAGFGDVPAAAPVLRARLDALDGKAARTQWGSLRSSMSTVEDAAHTALARAHEMTGIAEGLLARRTELRGRLEAYRAKAAARGLAEHGELTTLYTKAHELLITARCDLRASTRAVYAYQHTLASVLGGGASLISAGEGSAVDD